MTRQTVAGWLVLLSLGSAACKRDEPRHVGWSCRYEQGSCFCWETDQKHVSEGCEPLRCCFSTSVPWEPHAASQYRAQCACHETDGGACINPMKDDKKPVSHCP